MKVRSFHSALGFWSGEVVSKLHLINFKSPMDFVKIPQ